MSVERLHRRGRAGVLAAAAAIVVVGVTGLIVVQGRGAKNPSIPATAPPAPSTPATPSTPSTPTTVPAPTVAPTTDNTTTTSEPAPEATILQPSEQLPIVVELDPNVVEIDVDLSVDKFPNNGDEQIWIAPGSSQGLVIAQKGADYLEFAGPDGTRRVGLAEEVFPLLAVDNVLYGLGETAVVDGQPSARFVAVALTGPNEGSVIAESLQDWNTYLELPVGAFAAGSQGVVDQARNRGATVIDYVDEFGDPAAPLANAQALVAVDTEALVAGQPATVTVDGVPTFRIQTDEATGDIGLAGSLPAWSGNWGPHIPVLARDGTTLIATPAQPEATWTRIPAGWSVAAQGADGPIVVRDNGSSYDIATVDPVRDTGSPIDDES